MASDTDENTISDSSPDQAFEILGSKTRMAILQTLGEADGSLSFTELRQRVGLDPGGEFNYHLEKLTDHFVHQTDDGYELRQSGIRVIEAILSGAFTKTPLVEPTDPEIECQLCGAPTVVSYREEWVGLFCTECDGFYGYPDSTTRYIPEAVSDYGYLGGYSFPSAGLQGRTIRNVFETAATWAMSQNFCWAEDICPRCTAPLETEAHVCEEHKTRTTTCNQCGRRYAVLIHSSCTNCLNTEKGVLPHYLLSNTEFLSFLTAHGVNPFSPLPEFYELLITYKEEVVSVEPLKIRLTFTIDDNSIAFTVYDDLSVNDVTRRTSAPR